MAWLLCAALCLDQQSFSRKDGAMNEELAQVKSARGLNRREFLLAEFFIPSRSGRVISYLPLAYAHKKKTPQLEQVRRQLV